MTKEELDDINNMTLDDIRRQVNSELRAAMVDMGYNEIDISYALSTVRVDKE